MIVRNPFPISDYVSPEYFCDREDELERLKSAVQGNRNVAMLSIRRMGKTTLIKHLMYRMSEWKGYKCLYFDILPSVDLRDFVRIFSNAIVQDASKKKNFMKKMTDFLSSLQAKLVFDQVSGLPSVEFDFKSENESALSLGKIFAYLAKQKETYLIAIDEFQQILNYPEKNVEATLRTFVQNQHKDVFIFSGSSKHMMISMFTVSSRPFYQSGDLMEVNPIDKSRYVDFIESKFREKGRHIEKPMIEKTMENYHSHTFYIQYYFNRLFEKSTKRVKESDFKRVSEMILKERESVFYNYRSLLSDLQFKLMIALAKEGGTVQINAKAFIQKHGLPLPSSVNTAAKSLINKEMIYKENARYMVYDVFFEKWLEKTF
ncbi:MAG: AAA family ATPase [Bacteroidales bacterium]